LAVFIDTVKHQSERASDKILVVAKTE